MAIVVNTLIVDAVLSCGSHETTFIELRCKAFIIRAPCITQAMTLWFKNKTTIDDYSDTKVRSIRKRIGNPMETPSLSSGINCDVEIVVDPS